MLFVVAKRVRFVVAKRVYVVKAKAKAVCSQTALRMRAFLVGTSRPRAGHHQTAAVRGKGQGGRRRQDTPCPQEGVGWRAALV